MVHFKFFVEDSSGGKALNTLVPKIIGKENTFKIHSYKGIGHIPKDLKPKNDANKPFLLDQLHKVLQGIGKSYSGKDCKTIVIVVCDLDDRDKTTFLSELKDLLNRCNPRPETYFCLAVEEGEAWLLGDIPAIKQAYPDAKTSILNSYINDSICGTWELMAEALYHKGCNALKEKGWQAVGSEKSKWAEKISPIMDIHNNKSPSFNYFKTKLVELVNHT